MTEKTLNYSRNLFEVFWSGLKKSLEGMMIGWMLSRSQSANRYVAQQLIDIGEYRSDQYYEVLREINLKCIDSINKEFGRND